MTLLDTRARTGAVARINPVAKLAASALIAIPLILTLDWEAMFNDDIARAERTYRRKTDDELSLSQPGVGFTSKGVQIAPGILAGERILLMFEPGERLNVGQIAEVSTLARSTVSHHLKILHEY